MSGASSGIEAPSSTRRHRSSTTGPVTRAVVGQHGGVAASLLTLGHGTADQQRLIDLVTSAGITRLVDVRRFPGSRVHPHVSRDAMSDWLPREGVAYEWLPGLGGRRRTPPDSPDTWWQVETFRGYAAHMRTPEFLAAVDGLLEHAATADTAVMCSESLWWRCHRRLIADFAVLARGVPVRHLFPDGHVVEHEPAAGARLREDGLLAYDG